jgi:hypothetical protein
MVSSWYKDFIPMFEYTAKKYNDCDVRVFHKSSLFPKYHRSTVNLLRFLVPDKYFEKYDFVYFTDVDFVFVEQKPGLFSYHKHAMERTKQCYSGYRGPITKDGVRYWRGNYGRMAAGAFMATPKWFDRTRKLREKYARYVRDKRLYREEDETYLFKICMKSKLKVPLAKDCFVNGEEFDIDHRGLHLGDFKPENTRWAKTGRMRKRFLSDRCLKRYLDLTKDKRFRELKKSACENKAIARMFGNLKYHIGERCSG